MKNVKKLGFQGFLLRMEKTCRQLQGGESPDSLVFLLLFIFLLFAGGGGGTW